MQNLVPVQIWEGESNFLHEETIKFLQSHFCSRKSEEGSCFCPECSKIKNLSHASILWLSPAKNYSVEDIEIIFEKARFSLDPDEKFFFILEKAHFLTTVTGNRLLKVLEEPPKGYNFILLTNNLERLLPTIRSRGSIKQFFNKNEVFALEEYPLLQYFLDKNKFNDPTSFISDLKKYEITDNSSLELLNLLFKIFATKINSFYASKNNVDEKEKLYLTKALNFIKKQLTIPPQSGSSTLFWKNFYINFPQK